MRGKPVPKKIAAVQGSRSPILTFVKELTFILCAVLIINSFVMASFEVPTGSMEDTVAIGDRVFVNKFIYGGSTPYTIPLTSIRIPHLRVPGFRSVARGDVIVFDWPGGRDEIEKPIQMWYLKRCIGLPGDTILIKNQMLFVNGNAVPDPAHAKHIRGAVLSPGQADRYIFPRGSDFNADNYGPIAVPRKGMKLALTAANFPAWEVFIRREGHDAMLEDEQVMIDGRVAREYTVQRDYVFAMGDNRDNSLDSRFWGFVPYEDVIGTPMIVYWSWNPAIPIYHLIDKLTSVKLGRIGTIIH
ncbi:MAG: signal peptidase I [Acidobacteriia bacterium]|nr:signal peptidase I [Terriglobia bacterium]